MAFFQKIEYCLITNPTFLGDGICHNFGKYNTAGCRFDGGDCDKFNRDFPNCQVNKTIYLNDGRCDGGMFNTEECGWDGKDCEEFNEKYPGCSVEKPSLVGNGECDGGAYNTSECGWDGEDCLPFAKKYPWCVKNLNQIR